MIGLVCPADARVDRTWAALALGFTVFGVTDSVYLFQIAEGTYDIGTILDAGWVLGATVLASAVWMPETTRPSTARGWSAFAFPGVFGAIALAVLVYDHFQPVHLLSLALAVACIVAVLGRMTLVFSENMSMLASSREDADTDSLTGLWNRRKLVADLEQERHGVLVLLDLDGFKSYNDTYGHVAGDALLDRLGHGLAAVGAAAYRMGGDEFCVLGGRRRGRRGARGGSRVRAARARRGLRDHLLVRVRDAAARGARCELARFGWRTGGCTRRSRSDAPRQAARARTC